MGYFLYNFNIYIKSVLIVFCANVQIFISNFYAQIKYAQMDMHRNLNTWVIIMRELSTEYSYSCF